MITDKISVEIFKQKLDSLSSNPIIQIKRVEINNIDLLDINTFGKSFEFEDCIFNGTGIYFFNSQNTTLPISDAPKISFKNCIFNLNTLSIYNCTLSYLIFDSVQILCRHFSIYSSKISSITFVSSTSEKSNIKSLILNNLQLENTPLIILSTNFDNFSIENCNFKEIYLEKSISKTACFNGLTINKYMVINHSEFIETASFKNSNLLNFRIENSNIATNIEFTDVIFKETTFFSEIQSTQSIWAFNTCVFERNIHFHKLNIGKISLNNNFFNEILSLDEVRFSFNFIMKSCLINKTIFFGDLLIKNNLKSLDLDTLRIFKNQLLKSDNKIEYNIINAQEQRKYFQDLSWKDSDYYILWLNKSSNEFGTNWLIGIWFTFKTSVFFFLLLLLINSFVSSLYPLEINLHSKFAHLDDILINYLKFVFSFGFNSSEFQSNSILYIIFITAKIFIGLGIYQTVAAFRKFK